MQRPDPSQMVSKLFSKLDTDKQGYIEQSDLESALSSLDSSDSSTSAAQIFKQLDSDSDGKVTQDEMTSSLKALAEQLDSSFNASRTTGMGAMGGMPPPPPPPEGEDEGFTQDELTTLASEIGETDSARASLMSAIAADFDTADSNGDGKVTASEAMAYEQSQNTDTTTSTSSVASASDAESTSDASQLEVLRQIMQLMHAYAGPESSYSISSSLSISA